MGSMISIYDMNETLTWFFGPKNFFRCGKLRMPTAVYHIPGRHQLLFVLLSAMTLMQTLGLSCNFMLPYCLAFFEIRVANFALNG